MQLLEKQKLLEMWNYSLDQGANVVLMRHAPKSGSNESGLSEQGIRLTKAYGEVLARAANLRNPQLLCTSKKRTTDTLYYLFPSFPARTHTITTDLEVNAISPLVEKQFPHIHVAIGHFRRYYLNHTYYFLEKLGGTFGDPSDEANLHTVIAERMARGIKSLFDFNKTVVYCGHSPSIEVGLEKLLGLSLSELGGFLNPLDSIHLRKYGNQIQWVARINPIVGYVDLESETYFGRH